MFKLVDYLTVGAAEFAAGVKTAAPKSITPAPCARTGKIRYARRTETAEPLRALRTTDRHPEQLVAYRCWSCGDFHVGHK